MEEVEVLLLTPRAVAAEAVAVASAVRAEGLEVLEELRSVTT